MTWYYSDGDKQLGPISEAELVALRGSEVVTDDTLVWREGLANWTRYQEAGLAVDLNAPPPPLEVPPQLPMPPVVSLASDEAVCAECGKVFPRENMISHGAAYVCVGCKPVFVQKLAEGVAIRPAASNEFVTEEQLLAREYQVDVGSSLTRAWENFRKNAGTSLLVALIVAAILFGGAMISNLAGVVIPFANVILPLLYTIPLIAGAFWIFVRLIRQEPASVADVFAGFSNRYGNLLALGVAETILTYLFLTPAFLMGMGFVFLGNGRTSGIAPAMLPMFMLTMLIFIVGAAYVSTTLSFAPQLIIDKRYSFWPAMKLSFRLVHRRWWMTFGFMFVAGVIFFVGCLLCGVGALVSGPVYLGMRAALYNDNFRDLIPQR